MLNFENFKLLWLKIALKQIKKIPKPDQHKIIDKIESLIKIPTPPDIKKLQGFENLYRLRVGNYRIIFKVKNTTLIIAIIGHRKEIYRFLKTLTNLFNH